MPRNSQRTILENELLTHTNRRKMRYKYLFIDNLLANYSDQRLAQGAGGGQKRLKLFGDQSLAIQSQCVFQGSDGKLG